jgi:hypothetical protein
MIETMKKSTAFLAIAAVVASSFQPCFLANAQATDSAPIAAAISDDDLAVVISSSFKMSLYPTQEPMDATAANKVEHAIKTALLLSTSVTTNFVSVEDINIVLQKIEYEKSFEPLNPLSGFFTTTPASSLEFKVETRFLVDQEDADNVRLPSRNALDNLIVRTFSQPSSKSSFIVNLGLARDPILNEVLDIEIDIVDEPTSPTVVEDGQTISTIDIALITASAFIFLGIIAVICYYHNTRSDAEPERPTNSSKTAKKVPPVEEESNSIQIDTSNSKESTNNGTPNSSPKETDPVLLEKDANELEHQSDVIPFEENIVEGSSLESSVDGHSNVIPEAESPDASYASSTASTTRHSNSAGSRSSSEASDDSSSSSSSSSSSLSSSSSSGSEEDNSTEDTETNDKEEFLVAAQLLGAEQPNYSDSSVSSSSRGSDLAARLLNLSSISAFDLSRRFNLYSSSSSAPPILEDIREDESSVDERKADDKTVFSARSASSESFDSGTQANNYPRGKRGYWIGNTFRETAQQFHENWVESKRKALEDIEEGSVEDVFQIDVERAGAMEEDRSKASGHSSVSEWMKNIRVVGSASETQSSVEHSSVEPKSYTKDNSSVDLSLEQSLATSLVEV